jgi:hypothetical protein
MNHRGQCGDVSDIPGRLDTCLVPGLSVPRIDRVVVAGVAHHVAQRGNRQEQVFFSNKDRPSARGSIEFIERLERLTHRRLRPNKAGRPRKQA